MRNRSGSGRATALRVESLEDRTTPSFPLGFAFNFGGAGTVQPDAVATDVAGSLYVVGTFSGTAEFVPDGATPVTSQGASDAFVAKYSSSCDFLWLRQMGGSLQDFGEGVTVDTNGNVYVVGSFKGAAAFGTTTLTGAGGGHGVRGKVGWQRHLCLGNRSGWRGSHLRQRGGGGRDGEPLRRRFVRGHGCVRCGDSQ